jgi:hypothetical protein
MNMPWVVMTDFGPVADFEEKEAADKFAAKENEDEPGAFWVLFETTIGGGGFPKG